MGTKKVTGRGKKGGERRQFVQPTEGGWETKAAGAKRASSKHTLKSKAKERARQIVRNAGGGEVVIKGTDGRIQDSDTLPAGNDPFPPRDKKH